MLIFFGHKCRIALQRQMQIYFLPRASQNRMGDADVVSCCLHATVAEIHSCRSNCGDGGTKNYITDGESDLMSEKLD